MARYIDADALKKPVGSYNPVKYTYEYGNVITVDDIDHAPTADVVEVVRCRNCIHRNKYECNHIMLGGTKCDVTDDWYCADGERRDE